MHFVWQIDEGHSGSLYKLHLSVKMSFSSKHLVSIETVGCCNAGVQCANHSAEGNTRCKTVRDASQETPKNTGLRVICVSTHISPRVPSKSTHTHMAIAVFQGRPTVAPLPPPPPPALRGVRLQRGNGRL